MSVFTTDREVIDIGTKYLLIVSVFYVIFSTMFIINGLLRGAGDTLVPMLITLCALWVVRVPLSYLLSLKYDAVGIWWGIPAAWFCGMVLAYFYYLSGKWKTKSVVKYDR
jgi:Na+-driven multidrug efflux pump